MKEVGVGLLVVGLVAMVGYLIFALSSVERIMQGVALLLAIVTGIFTLYLVGFFILSLFGDRRASRYNGCGD